MSAHRHVDVALLVVAVAWGSSYLAAKEVATTESVFGFLVIRFALAAAGLMVVLGTRLRRITRSEIAFGGLFGTILSVIFTLETFGLTTTSASNAGLIISLTIVLTPLLEQWIHGTRLPATFYCASMVAVLGVGLLTQRGGYARPSLGDVLMVLAAAARAGHVIVMAHLSRGRSLNPGCVTLVQICFCLAVFSTVAQFTGRGAGDVAAHLPLQGWLITAYLALACTVFAFVIQAWAVRRTSPARVSLLLGTEPLWAAAVGILVAGDPLSVAAVAGAMLVLAGTNWGRTIVVASSSEPRPAPSQAPPSSKLLGRSTYLWQPGSSCRSSSARASRRMPPRLRARRWRRRRAS
ncbi:DMT family transporter [Mycolicibacterium helvum]|uniref:Multidrug transporter n=1 Tax=Mycolicibacterium helvum TaxID=1534349 RepID=A0A7I7T6C0_9MYCO|nr:DMT family transporter [Mycolicibacterium helvum]BBY63656.1 multidrug transporter [Mycolicibacterium helvum]